MFFVESQMVFFSFFFFFEKKISICKIIIKKKRENKIHLILFLFCCKICHQQVLECVMRTA